MRALRKVREGLEGVRLCEVERPVPAADEIRVKVAYVGICGTDIHIMTDEYQANLPVTMGHEYSGVVDAVGADVSDFKPGDRVISTTVGYSCKTCRYCRSGHELQCRSRKSIGSGMDGAMAEYVVVKAERAFHLPEEINLRTAALAEPVGCCVRSVIETSRVKAGDFVYISGPGIMGQITAQLCKLAGAHVTVGGISVDGDRLALAKKLGADEVLDDTAADFSDCVREITGGDGFDVAFECAGARASADVCLRVLRPMGQYVQLCLFGKSIPFDLDAALIGEKHIVSSFASERSSFAITLRLMQSGKLQLEDLISAVYPMDQWQTAVERVLAKKDFKILLTPAE